VGVFDWLFAQFVLAILKLSRLLPARAAISAGGRCGRVIGPLLPHSRVARDNLRHAFPDMPANEREALLADAWDNLSRTAIEYVFLDRIFDFDPDHPGAGRIEVDGAEGFIRIRDGGRPCIVFTAHLANWELLAVCAATFNLDVAVLFRPPNNAYLAQRLDEVRGRVMGALVKSRKGALIELGAALERGGHVGLLVDQHFRKGPRVPFFGRPVTVNPALGTLARRYDCDVYGARTIRLPEGRFRLQVIGPIALPRDAAGEVDTTATMAKVTGIVEGWVREHPEQWLWMHRRWRPEAAPRRFKRRSVPGTSRQRP
jgi:Kdo2-lipid IVA lauroyltransferase/acyltransferase